MTPTQLWYNLGLFSLGVVLAMLAIWALALGWREGSLLHPAVWAAIAVLLAAGSIIALCSVASWWAVGITVLVVVATLGSATTRRRRF